MSSELDLIVYVPAALVRYLLQVVINTHKVILRNRSDCICTSIPNKRAHCTDIVRFCTLRI